MRKLLIVFLIAALVFSSGCKVIYKNRVPVTKPKQRYGWFKPQYKKRKRTKTVWMKVHKAKKEKTKPAEETLDAPPVVPDN